MAIILTVWRMPIVIYDIWSCVLVARARVHRPPLRTFLTAIPFLYKKYSAAERSRLGLSGASSDGARAPDWQGVLGGAARRRIRTRGASAESEPSAYVAPSRGAALGSVLDKHGVLLFFDMVSILQVSKQL